MTDCAVTLTHSGYWARQSHAHGTFDASVSSLEYAFAGYRPVHGAVPSRPRTDRNPLDREEYLLRVQRRV